ncbi:hypothetical protein JCM10450v2_006422 [Rhodotorula kratochvilovae]
MRFSLAALFALAAPAVLAIAVPDRASAAAALQQVADQLTFGAETLLGDGPCPDLLVRCIKKGDNGDEIIGDIGKQGYKHAGGLKCVQRHETKNKAECNAKYPIDCATKCEAVGSPL